VARIRRNNGVYALKVEKLEVRELNFQHKPLNFSVAPPAMRAGPIRCWCEWIFDAIFAFLFLNLYLRFINDPFRLPFPCIFTNLEVWECYLPIIRGARSRSLASQAPLTIVLNSASTTFDNKASLHSLAELTWNVNFLQFTNALAPLLIGNTYMYNQYLEQ